MRDFGEVEKLQVSRKGIADFVTKADTKAERVLHDELLRTRPHYSFVMEEGGTIEGPDKTHRWYIDPIDGTTNFLHGLPHFAISIALEREGQLVAGLVFNPITDDMFIAEKGKGAWHNETRLRVSGPARDGHSAGCDRHSEHGYRARETRRILDRAFGDDGRGCGRAAVRGGGA